MRGLRPWSRERQIRRMDRRSFQAYSVTTIQLRKTRRSRTPATRRSRLARRYRSGPTERWPDAGGGWRQRIREIRTVANRRSMNCAGAQQNRLFAPLRTDILRCAEARRGIDEAPTTKPTAGHDADASDRSCPSGWPFAGGGRAAADFRTASGLRLERYRGFRRPLRIVGPLDRASCCRKATPRC